MIDRALSLLVLHFGLTPEELSPRCGVWFDPAEISRGLHLGGMPRHANDVGYDGPLDDSANLLRAHYCFR